MSGWQALAALPPSEIATILGLPVIYVTAFIVFTARCALYGMPRTPRFDKLSRSFVAPRFLLEYGFSTMIVPVRVMVALGISANAVTYASLVVATSGAVLFALGRFAAGGFLIYLSFMFDAMDGMVARMSGTSSDRGEFLDAMVDRYADFAVFLGFMWYYRDDSLGLPLATLALIGSSVMGYARAKGESVGIDPNVGWMQRHERAVVIGTATTFSAVAAAFLETGVAHPRHYFVLFSLALIAVLSNVTAIWRAHYVMVRMPVTRPSPVAPWPEPDRDPEVAEPPDLKERQTA